jgi:chaperonin GroES
MFKTTEDKIILKPIRIEEETTKSGLLLISAHTEKTNEAIVVEVGPGRVLPNGTRLPVDVAVGDKVMFNPMAIQSFEHEGEDYFAIFSKDILVILDNNE